MDDLLIWWTDEADCKGIIDAGRVLPGYLLVEFTSRYGRAGRGRLWVPTGIPLHEIPWDTSKMAARTIDQGGHAGIVFRRDDLAAVRALPGFITDLELNIV